MINKETNFEDAEQSQFGNNDNLTFKDIVLQHLKKITIFASVEMRGGFWQETPHPNPSTNAVLKVWTPDSREVYSNAVECLSDMLSPYFDEVMTKAEDKIIKEITKSYERNTINITGSKTKSEFKKLSDGVNFKIETSLYNKQLFRDLNKFLYRKKYLELGSVND